DPGQIPLGRRILFGIVVSLITIMCLAMDVFACLLVLPGIGPISKAIIIYD
ncbi:hypothetical protein Tco_0067677, partial [Tanacetum coccineum]